METKKEAMITEARVRYWKLEEAVYDAYKAQKEEIREQYQAELAAIHEATE